MPETNLQRPFEATGKEARELAIDHDFTIAEVEFDLEKMKSRNATSKEKSPARNETSTLWARRRSPGPTPR